MKRLLIAVPVMALFLGSADRAAAQYHPYQPYTGSPYSYYQGGSTLSPWLQLGRGGNSAANYYLGVLPEMDRRANDRRFQAALLGDQRATERQFDDLQKSLIETVPGYNPLSPTGTYSNYDFKGQFFPRRGR